MVIIRKYYEKTCTNKEYFASSGFKANNSIDLAEVVSMIFKVIVTALAIKSDQYNIS